MRRTKLTKSYGFILGLKALGDSIQLTDESA